MARIFTTAALGLALAVSSAPARAEDPATFECDVQPIVAEYCFGCHKPPRVKGGVDLSRFATSDEAREAVEIWGQAKKRMAAREMPPGDAPKPSDEQRRRMFAWIDTIEPKGPDCGQIGSEQNINFYRGYVMSRRLNRAEHENAVRDLFGVSIPLRDLFPADGAGGEGFDNNGDALFLSPIHVEKHLQAADLIVETVLPEREYERWSEPERAWARMAEAADAQGEGSAPSLARANLLRRIDASAPAPRGAARPALEWLAPRAFRRPATRDEIEKLLGLVDQAAREGRSIESGLRRAIKAVLLSPSFLFFPEPEPAKQGVYRLNDFQIAARLAAFLWSSSPDQELYDLAAAGKLGDADTMRVQIARMTRDPKARALARGFAAQWLEIEGLGGAKGPDPERFPEFTPELAAAMRDETELFFARIIGEDRSVLELIDADYTFANAALAPIYGLQNVEGADMRLVQLDDRNRGGVLGMASVLTSTSHPLRTSPVLRGKWVMEQILGERVPPPPPNVPPLPEDDRQLGEMTLRQRLSEHRANAECASCHQKMDPLGFGLENFDPIGRWRTEESPGKPIDAAGELPSGEKFGSPAELKGIVLARKEAFTRHLAKKMTGYAFGRSLTPNDQCVINDATKALAERDHRASALIETIALSQPFQSRYSGGEIGP